MAEKVAEEPKNPKRLSRRKFLFLAAGGLAAAPFAVAELQRRIIRIFAQGFSFPETTQTIVAAALKICEKGGGKENPHYRPMGQIIQEAAKLYEATAGKQPVYKRSASYRDKKYYAMTLEAIGNGIVLPQPPTNLMEKFKDSFPPEAWSVYAASDSAFGQFSDIYCRGSGFWQRFKERHPGIVRPEDTVTDHARYFSLAEEDGKLEMEKAKLFVEKTSREHNGPISASWIANYFLQENSGSLAESVFDTAIFLKLMTTSFQPGKPSSPQENIDWYQKFVLDEYQGPSYAESADQESRLNLIGKPYHSWNLVGLLPFFPIEFIHLGGIYRQMTHMKKQGLPKTQADMQTLNDLRETETALLSYK